MIKLEKMVKKLELILAGVMLPTMIIFVVLELDRLMTGTEKDYGYLAITMIMTLLLLLIPVLKESESVLFLHARLNMVFVQNVMVLLK